MIKLNKREGEIVSEALEQLATYYLAVGRFAPGEAILNLTLWRPSEVKEHPDREKERTEVAAVLSAIRATIYEQLT